jgi:hypothetical protein
VALVGGFFLLRATGGPVAPEQPVAFDHWQHVTKKEGPQLDCAFCHEYADRSPHATIPNTEKCMLCHETERTDNSEVQKLAAYVERREQPPWARVFYFDPSANVFFSHKAHARAGIDCALCHGPVSEMRQVRREINQSMGWCMDCHRERQASVDCYICHR